MSEPPDEFLKRYDAALLTLRYWGSMSLIVLQSTFDFFDFSSSVTLSRCLHLCGG